MTHRKGLGIGMEHILSILVLVLLVSSFPASVIHPDIFASASLNIHDADGGNHEKGLYDETNQEDDLGTVQSPEHLIWQIKIKLNGGSELTCNLQYVTEYGQYDILDSVTTFAFYPDPCVLVSSSDGHSNNVTITIDTAELSPGTYRGELEATAQASNELISAIYYFKFEVETADNNSAPVAYDQSVSTDEDTPRPIVLNSTDSDLPPDSLNYSIVSGPSHGSLGDISGNEVTYTPAANYSGLDSFTYKVNDGTADSNVATVNMTVFDRTPPISTIDAVVDGNGNLVENNGFAISNSVTFTFHADDGGSGVNHLECSLDGTEYAVCSSPHTENELDDGRHVFSVRAIDNTGNLESTAVWTFTVDTLAIAAPIITSPVAGTYNMAEQTVSGTSEPGSSVEVFDLETSIGDAVADVNGTWSLGSISFPEGGHYLTAIATDEAGNASPAASAVIFTIDITPPETSITSFPENPSDSPPYSFNFTSSDEVATFECQLDGGGFSACDSPTSYESLPTGSHTFDVRATDEAGNTDASPASYTWTVDAQPEEEEALPALEVTPGSGTAGESVSLDGTGFTPGSTIDQITIGVAGQSNPASIKPDGTLVTVDARGHWNLSPIALPSDLVPGVYVVKATGSDSKTAQTTFQVLPPGPSFDVSLSTDSVSVQAGDPPGADIAMGVNSANGFADSLELTVSNLPVGMRVVYSDGSGNVIMTASGKPGGNNVTGSPVITPVVNGMLDITVNVSAGSGTPSGMYQVFFGAKDPASGDSKARLAGVTVTTPATPAITFSPLMAQPGSSINVLGSNFGPSEPVTIQFNGLNSGTDGFAVTPSSLATTAGGTFSAAFTVPSLAGGIYQVVVAGSSGQAISTFQVLPVLDTATVQLQIAPKALVLPAGSGANQTVTIVPIGQFSSDLQLTATPEASGIGSIAFLPASALEITPGIPSPVGMELSLSASAVPGSVIPIRVEAEAGGSTITTEYAYVRVADAAGDFFISASPIDLVAARGTTVSSDLILVTTGLSGSPVLSLSGLPDGITGAILDVTPIDAAGMATATVQLSVPADAPLATSVFTLHGSFAGRPEKQISMSISVVSTAPISVESGVIDPTTVTENVPLYLTFPFGDGGTIELIVYSLATSTYGTTNIDYLLLPDIPDGEAEPTGYSLLLTGGANLDSANPFVNVDYDIRVTMPGTSSADLSVGFLDTGQDPPIWTPLPASSTFNGDPCGENSACATGVMHFSSWGLLATAALAPPASGGSSGHGGSHSSSDRHVLVNPEVAEGTELLEEPIFDTGNLPIVVEEVVLQPVDTVHEDDTLRGELAMPGVESNALITPFIGTARDDPDVFYADKWKIQPHVTGVDPLARFFEPTARITIVFDIEPTEHEGSTGVTTTVIRYDIVDEKQSVIFSGQFLLDGEISELVHKKAFATVPSSGVYSLVLAASSESLDTVQRMERTTIAVPWLTPYTSVLIEIALVIAAGFIGYAAFRHSSRKDPMQIEKDITIVESTFDRYVHKIRFSIPTVIIAVVGLMLVAGFFIVFAGDKAAQETVGMWVTNVTASVVAIFAVILFVKKRSGPHAKIELALAIGLVLWLGSRAVESWFNMVILTLLSEEVLHHVYPGDFLLTFVTGHDLDVFNQALGGNFGWIYGLFTALKMGGFALFNFHLIKASRLFADRYGKKLPLVAMIAPAIFLAIIAVAYVNVLLGQILLQDLAIHFGYVMLISMMMVPSTILLVVLRKDTKKELFWILSTLSLLSFVVAYSWQAFVPVGPDPEQYLTWLEQNVWLSALLFGGDYLLMAFALLWEIRTHKMEHHESVAA